MAAAELPHPKLRVGEDATARIGDIRRDVRPRIVGSVRGDVFRSVVGEILRRIVGGGSTVTGKVRHHFRGFRGSVGPQLALGKLRLGRVRWGEVRAPIVGRAGRTCVTGTAGDADAQSQR